MDQPKVAWVAKQADLGNINSLIDFLEWAREVLKTEEGSELRVLIQPEDGALEFQVLDGREGPIRRVVLGSHIY